jgi:ATP-binding cassette, subfamily B, bacterial
MACGATCLKMIAKYYGKALNLDKLLELTSTTREGANLQGLIDASEKIGIRSIPAKISVVKLKEFAPFPCILHWNESHYVVLFKENNNKFFVADPSHGIIKYSKDEFIANWCEQDSDKGILLILEPTPEFDNLGNESDLIENKNNSNLSFLKAYLRPHKKAITHLIIGLFIGSLLQLTFPFLTQSIVDIGINNKDIKFIYIVYLAQLMIFLGRSSIDIIRGYVLMHISNKVSISLVSDFFMKLMKLPIAYFDVKKTGDLLQRINDNQRIENFLTGSSLNTLFSLFNFFVFSIVLALYSLNLFLVFLIGSSLYFAWLIYFLKKRAELDYKLFNQHSENQSKVVEIISGMQEIKLQNAEKRKRWEWEILQSKLFGLNLKGLKLNTLQTTGAGLINELKNVLIMFIAANYVLENTITLGMLLSISYIIGQLNAPVAEMAVFIHQWQDAKMSLNRLVEIHNKKDEEKSEDYIVSQLNSDLTIKIENLSFKYNSSIPGYILDNINVNIPENKITAIVGSSGSGKTTLLKILLKYYEPSAGNIFVGGIYLNNISFKTWRNSVGVVMQEGYIFSDTIANNITIGEVTEFNKERLEESIRIANLQEFINSLPLNYNTKIGDEGIGLSSGQKQRILIARAVYKNAKILFFDEATSALDSKNERIIMENLNAYYKNKTVIIVAHRLSTVKNADNILVLNNGEIIEQGNHTELVKVKGLYYELIQNQLELGN